MVLQIDEILNLAEWEHLQDSIAELTQLAIVLIDYKGRTIGKHSAIQPFCKIVRENKELSKYCEKCDARGALESVRQGEPFIYQCHFLLVDMAVPILMNGEYLGAIMAGQVRLEEKNFELEQLLTIKEVENQLIKYKQEYEKIPILKLEVLEKSANMLTQLSHYLLSEAVKKEYLIHSYKNELTIDFKPEEPLEELVEELNHALLTERLLDTSFKARDRALQSTVDLMIINKSKMYHLKDLAEFSHISEGHLSRLLKKEFKEPFNQFYPKLKIKWAKELLIKTDKSISEISEELGFADASYFIRSFNKIEGMTPLRYRKIS